MCEQSDRCSIEKESRLSDVFNSFRFYLGSFLWQEDYSDHHAIPTTLKIERKKENINM